ncbi:MAG: hypothetical protein IT425_09995 [Pirellulales bacterium]|nr:hypothetical protein [Pirellulales bacterium]
MQPVKGIHSSRITPGNYFMHHEMPPSSIPPIRFIALTILWVGALPFVSWGRDVPAPPTPLPTQVDLRPQLDQWGLGPRNQGPRNTCSVFATMAAFEFAYSKHVGHGEKLSAEYLNWACNQVIHNHSEDRGQFFHHLLQGFARFGICKDEQMPYTDHFDPQLEPSSEARATAKDIQDMGFLVHWIRPIQAKHGLSNNELLKTKRVLASGYPVAAGASHSRLFVGYQEDANQPGGGIFLTKDSAGGEYRTVTYEFVKTEVNDVFWVEEPKRSAAGK